MSEERLWKFRKPEWLNSVYARNAGVYSAGALVSHNPTRDRGPSGRLQVVQVRKAVSRNWHPLLAVSWTLLDPLRTPPPPPEENR